MERSQVVIVGAGPVGLSAALCLAGHGVAPVVLEKREGLSAASKASTFHAPTLEMIEEFGALAPMLERGRIADRIQYRTSDGAVMAEFDHALLDGLTPHPFRLHLEQSALTPLLLERLVAGGRGEVRFGWSLQGVATDEEGATLDCHGPDGRPRQIRADYVLGADGAHSTVREALGIALEGESYPGQVLRLVVLDDLARILPGLGQISYIFAPDGTSLSLLQMPDCWRVIIRLPEGFDADAVTRPEWYMPVVRRYIPGLDAPLRLREHDIYGARKMLAGTHGRGRVHLIGDALHLTNTRGGMNMNCGIHDAYEMGAAIAAAIAAGDPAIAERAAAHRHAIARNELLPRTDRNVRGGAEWLAHVQAVAGDPAQARDMLIRTAMLDMAPPRRPRAATTGMEGPAR